MRWLYPTLTCLFVLIASGCSGEKFPEKVEVSGQLKANGKGVDGTGFALEFSVARGGATLDLDSEGKFSGQVTVGENEVRIVGKGGGHDADPGLVNKLLGQGVPIKYLDGALRHPEDTSPREALKVKVEGATDNLVIDIPK